ncbi:MAG: ribosome maturation factor RimM [Acidimicrobiales bacterium]
MLEVGRVARAHGLGGEVIVALTTNRTERLDPGSVLTADGDRRLEVQASRPHQGRFIVRFAGVDDRSSAEGLRGTVLRAPPLAESSAASGGDDDDSLWVHELIGSEVRGVDGAQHGRVASVEANPASDLLVLEDGRLVPLTFVVSSADGLIVVDPPPGLLD